MLIDSHAHVISDDFDKYPVGPIGGQLKPGVVDQPITAESLLRTMDLNGVERSVLVQRAHIYGYNNDYVVDCAAKYPDRFLSVCCVDARRPDAAEKLKHLVKHRGAMGVRLMAPVASGHLTATNDPGNVWFGGEAALEVWKVAGQVQIPLCIHFIPGNRLNGLGELSKIAQRMPDVDVVVDHISNIDPAAKAPHYGIDEALLSLAPLQNVYLKLATINLAKWRSYGTDGSDVLSVLLGHFGPDRILWGSDIGQTKLEYSDMLDLAIKALEPFNDGVKNAILGQTADKLYFRTRTGNV